MKSYEAHQSVFAMVYANTLQSQVLYLFGEPERALTYSEAAGEIIIFVSSAFVIVEHNFYQSLILADLAGKATDEEEKNSLLERLQACQQQMTVWVDHCSENFLHKRLLVAAELLRLEGRMMEAMNTYDQAIDTARRHGFTQDEALANELAGRFWLARGKEKFAAVYLQDAHQNYRNWGAVRKVEALEQEFPHVLARRPAMGSGPISTDTTGSLEGLDLTTVLRATRTIREEKELSDLVTPGDADFFGTCRCRAWFPHRFARWSSDDHGSGADGKTTGCGSDIARPG